MYDDKITAKFIPFSILFQVIAEESGTSNKSSTATITVSITDTNDNRPVFDEESYSISVLGMRKMFKFVLTDK